MIGLHSSDASVDARVVAAQPLLSIITPVFNGERFLRDCIQNVIDQGQHSTEHLFVDGGSTDRTLDIIREYAEGHPQIRWLSEKDRGQSDAMNKGIALARGDFISFLNADDFYEPGVLPKICTLVAEADPEIRSSLFLIGNCRVIDEEGRIRTVNKPGKLRRNWMLTGISFRRFPVNPSAYFYNKSLHACVGLYKVEEHGHMDLEFILRALPAAHYRYFDEVWGNFRYYRGTKTFVSANADRMDDNILAVLRSFQPTVPKPQSFLVRPTFWFVNTRLYRVTYKAAYWFFSRVIFTFKEPRKSWVRVCEILLRRDTQQS